MKRLMLATFLVLFNAIAFAQLEKPVKWQYKAERISKNEAVIHLKAIMNGNWHIYSQTIQSAPMKTSFTFSPSNDFSLVGKTAEPKPITKYDKVVKMNLSYFEKTVVFKQKIKLKKSATVVKGKLEFMACNDKSCLPSEEIAFSIPVK
ncbi:MAG: sugar transporter [Pedobacter sp.]|nr:MAG: sugar transporter [Pedobacter sp.]